MKSDGLGVVILGGLAIGLVGLVWWAILHAVQVIGQPTPAGCGVGSFPCEVPPTPKVYSRGQFRHWADWDGDCQDARAEVLIRDSSKVVEFATPRNCRVVEGEWVDWYGGGTLEEAGGLDVDHLVPLKWAWERGARDWGPFVRELFANWLADPDHLVVTRARLNRQKGAKGPADWWPPRPGARCRYAKAWVRVTRGWGLRLEPREVEVLEEKLEGCE